LRRDLNSHHIFCLGGTLTSYFSIFLTRGGTFTSYFALFFLSAAVVQKDIRDFFSREAGAGLDLEPSREKGGIGVALELNKQGIPTKKGKQWNARAVRDVLTNELYIGKYKVAGVEAQVEGCRIIDDGLFQRATKTMGRYVNSGAKRPPMPENRKKAKIDRIFNEYLEFLKEMEEDREGIEKS
jgi:hypothetical protein